MTRLRKALLCLAGLSAMAVTAGLAGCAEREPEAPSAAIPYVRTTLPQPASGFVLGASGTVRAAVETPLAFQVGGRIVTRTVDAGQTVRRGDILMQLDPHDLDQAVAAAQAEQSAAASALATAESDLRRDKQLREQNFVSSAALEGTLLRRQEAQSRLDVAGARLAQALSARAYADLMAPANGSLIDVTGEPGQVVATGQQVAILAQDGREVEVFLPDGLAAPATGQLPLPDGQILPLVLRELAGAVDPLGRTRRARYTIQSGGDSLVLGSVVSTRFDLDTPDKANPIPVFSVPVAALDERGQQAQVWRVEDGKARAVPVQLLALDSQKARVRGLLTPQDDVIAMGTHLLREGMDVRRKEAP